MLSLTKQIYTYTDIVPCFNMSDKLILSETLIMESIRMECLWLVEPDYFAESTVLCAGHRVFLCWQYLPTQYMQYTVHNADTWRLFCKGYFKNYEMNLYFIIYCISLCSSKYCLAFIYLQLITCVKLLFKVV